MVGWVGEVCGVWGLGALGGGGWDERLGSWGYGWGCGGACSVWFGGGEWNGSRGAGFVAGEESGWRASSEEGGTAEGRVAVEMRVAGGPRKT